MTQPYFLLNPEVSVESKAKLFKIIPIPQFVVNRPFIIRYRFQNASKIRFPGGPIQLRIKWYGGAEEYVCATLPVLTPRQWSQQSEKELNAHAVGMGIVYYYSSPSANGRAVKLLVNGIEKGVQDEDRTIYGIPTTTMEEIYAMVGLWVVAIGLVYPLFKDLLPVLIKLIN